MKWILIFSLLVAPRSFADDLFSIPVGDANVGPVTHDDANQVASALFLQQFFEVFQETAKPLVMQVLWESPYFGAGTVQDDTQVYIRVFGGMIRTPEMTEDIFAAILCHEIGHILGGEPFQDIPGSEWTSVEGQADFYAASVCLPRYFKKLNPILSLSDLRSRIEGTAVGFLNLMQKYAFTGQGPVLLTNTAPEVATVLNRHTYPSDQCRLDTFKAGAQCLISTTCRAPVCWLPK